MELFIVDAFTNQIFEGNQAGVVLLDEHENFPNVTTMQKVAAELKHSETAFVKKIQHNIYEIKYYTPTEEIPLCGHATISSFTVLRNEKGLKVGEYFANTLAGNLRVTVESNFIWLEMANGKLLKNLNKKESLDIYQAFGLDLKDIPDLISPCIVNTGLADILLPVNSKLLLDKAIQNREEVIRISKEHDVIGVHMFFHTSSSEVTAYCRNFAPLCGIDEESATGTSNGALTYYLHAMGLINDNSENIFIQGEAMKKPSVIKSKINCDNTIYIGGTAIISIKGHILL